MRACPLLIVVLALPVSWRDCRCAELQPLRIKPGDTYRVSTKSTLKGYLELPDPKTNQPRRIAIDGTARVVYRERALRADAAGQIDRVFRVYDLVDYQRKVDDQQQEAKLRDAVRRVALHRRDGAAVPYSPDGPLQWTEIDLIRTHIYAPLLDGFLGNGPLKEGATWDAGKSAVAELTGLQPLESGVAACSYNGTVEFQGKRLGQIAFTGTVVGRTDEGRSRNTINGAAYIDQATSRLQSLRATGERALIDANDKVVGRLAVDYQHVMTPIAGDADLADDVVAKLPDEPGEAQTALLYEHAGLGARLLHSRRWLLESVRENQITLRHEADTLVIHVEAEGKTPALRQYHTEVLDYLRRAKFVLSQTTKPQEVVSEAGRIGRFRVEGELDRKPIVLDYWVVERGKRGATVAARLRPESVKNLAADVQKIARELEFTTPAKPAVKAEEPTKKPEK